MKQHVCAALVCLNEGEPAQPALVILREPGTYAALCFILARNGEHLTIANVWHYELVAYKGAMTIDHDV